MFDRRTVRFADPFQERATKIWEVDHVLEVAGSVIWLVLDSLIMVASGYADALCDGRFDDAGFFAHPLQDRIGRHDWCCLALSVCSHTGILLVSVDVEQEYMEELTSHATGSDYKKERGWELCSAEREGLRLVAGAVSPLECEVKLQSGNEQKFTRTEMPRFTQV